MKAAFLDRDGIINIDKGYLYKISDFEYQTGIISFLRFLQQKDFLIFIITNQSGVGRGMYTEADVKNLHKWLLDDLSKKSIKIGQIEFCPHIPSKNCDCRKPKTGMISKILLKYPNIKLNESLLVGDKNSDIQCGKNAGIKFNFLINTEITDLNNQFFTILNKL